MNEDVAQKLFDEYAQFYENLMRDHGRVPRSISGISPDGKQFIAILDGVNLDHVERHRFIKAVLEYEKATTYAYAILIGVLDEGSGDVIEEQVQIIVATSNRYILGYWKVVGDRGGPIRKLEHVKTYTGSNPGYPGTWFLTNVDMLNLDKESRLGYEEMWKGMRSNMHFRSRQDIADAQPRIENIRGYVFPRSFDQFNLHTVINNENDSPGLGYTLHYHAPGVKASVYVYDNGISHLPEGIDSSMLREHFNEVKKSLQVVHPDAQVLVEEERLEVSGLPFLHSTHQYAEAESGKRDMTHSHIYLTSHRGSIVKLRISYLTADPDGIRAHVLFVKALRFGYTHLKGGSE